MGRGDDKSENMQQSKRQGPFVLDQYLNDWAADWNLFSERTLDIIADKAQEVEEESGTYRFLDCGMASSAWYRVFREAGIPVRIVSGAYHENLNVEGQVEDSDGGISSPPLSADHTWLEVEGHLLDATASQFVSPERPFSRDNYFAEIYYDGDPGEEENMKLWKEIRD
jgi:hypothetical protein